MDKVRKEVLKEMLKDGIVPKQMGRSMAEEILFWRDKYDHPEEGSAISMDKRFDIPEHIAKKFEKVELSNESRFIADNLQSILRQNWSRICNYWKQPEGYWFELVLILEAVRRSKKT